MTPLTRWWRFSLVGMMGMALQLATLALLTHGASGHCLLASAAAIELALLHNFVWHLHYTWRERRDKSALAASLLRFHLSNGLVSMLGNLTLMHLLVQGARVPVLAANSIAILCCSILNFTLADLWAFSPSRYRDDRLSHQSNRQ